MREFTFTEERILEAKEKFDSSLRRQPELTRQQRLEQWRTFMERWQDDLLAQGWRRFETKDVQS